MTTQGIYLGLAVFFTLLTITYNFRNLTMSVMGAKRVEGGIIWISVILASVFWGLFISVV